MSTTQLTTSLAVFALLAAGSAVQAAGDNTFKALDTDANGYISATEATANQDLSARWEELDKDKNNQLDQSEFSAFEAGTDNSMMKDGGMHQGGTMSPEK